MNSTLNFAGATREPQYPLIQAGTLVKVRLDIQQGGYNDESRGWTHNMATQGQTGAVYLKCEFKILDGEFKGRKIWSLIGLHSPKGDTYEKMGRILIKQILESSRGIDPNNTSEEANKKRCITSLADLDNITFIAEVSVGTDHKGNPKNEIKKAITIDHSEYLKHMNNNLHLEQVPF
jgi:hypothetical protein